MMDVLPMIVRRSTARPAVVMVPFRYVSRDKSGRTPKTGKSHPTPEMAAFRNMWIRKCWAETHVDGRPKQETYAIVASLFGVSPVTVKHVVLGCGKYKLKEMRDGK